MPPKVYVLILNHNGVEHLKYCLPSVMATEYPDTHVILIDNGSEDGSLAFVRANFEEIAVIENERNLGWAAGNNVGIRYALGLGADYVVLLNNDMRVDPRWLTHAVRAAESDFAIGAVGFDTIGEYHLEVDPNLELFKRRRVEWQHLEVKETEHVGGCALFLRSDLLRDVGLLDERFFAYGEEDDLQKRARRAGYRSVRVNLPLWHYNGGFWLQSRLLRASVLAQRNHLRVMIKNDSFKEAVRRFRDVVVFVCWPGVEYDTSHAHLRRLRPSNYLVNVLILLYAIIWNIVAMPATLLARYHDEKRVRLARDRLAELHTLAEGDCQ